MRILLAKALVVVMAVCRAATAEAGTNIFEDPGAPIAESQLDKLVFGGLTRAESQPALCSDAVFVRRVFLDLIGTLPTATEARDFIQDPDAKNKRRVLIDRLLERDEFADYWAMKWGDTLRIKAEFPVNLWPNAAQAYHRWVRSSLAENKPYDQFARELITSSGSNFRVGQVNFFRAIQNRTPEGIARAVALTFMGARAESWPTNRLAGMMVFFSQIGYKPTSEWKEEHVFWDPLGSSTATGSTAPGRAAVTANEPPSNSVSQLSFATRTNHPSSEAFFPDGRRVKLPAGRDPREVFADWLISPKNPWFTRSIVNRVWAWLLGRGIVHEPDDIRDDNPPSNPALLAYLEREMIAGNYDLRRIYRLVLNSRTYQLSSMPQTNTLNPEVVFNGYAMRRLDAEVLSDAINKVTGGADLYTSPIPEPFTYIPKGMPAVAIADGSITSPFLALFGRSARATGMANERNNRPTPAQWLYLLNSSDIQRKLEQSPNLLPLFNSRSKPSEIIEVLYLTILSRFPTPEELRTAEDYTRPQTAKPASPDKPERTARPGSVTNSVPAADPDSAVKRGPVGSLGKSAKSAGKSAATKTRDDWVDIAWALINSEEFLFRH